MSVDMVKNLIEEGKVVSFYRASEEEMDRGLFVCRVDITKDNSGRHLRGDSVYIFYADTVDELFSKTERRDW